MLSWVSGAFTKTKKENRISGNCMIDFAFGSMPVRQKTTIASLQAIFWSFYINNYGVKIVIIIMIAGIGYNKLQRSVCN